MKISSMFEFAFGKEVNFGNEIKAIPYMTTLDFNKDVEGYGFAIRDGVDVDLAKMSSIIPTINLPYRNLNGIIEFKTEKSGNAPEQTKELYLLCKSGRYLIPELSSPLKEIVLWFPKSLNKLTGEISIIFEDIEFYEA